MGTDFPAGSGADAFSFPAADLGDFSIDVDAAPIPSGPKLDLPDFPTPADDGFGDVDFELADLPDPVPVGSAFDEDAPSFPAGAGASLDAPDLSLLEDFPVIRVGTTFDSLYEGPTFPTDPGTQLDLWGGPDVVPEPFENPVVSEDAPLTGQQAYEGVLVGGAGLSFLDGADGEPIAYNFATSYNDFNYPVVAAPTDPETVSSIDATAAEIDAFYERVGVPMDRPIGERIVYTDGLDGEGLGGTLAAYNNDNDRVVLNVAEAGGLAPDTLIHEAGHDALNASGFSDAIVDNVPGEGASLALEEGLAETFIGEVRPGEDVEYAAYPDEVDFVEQEVWPRIADQGLDPDAVLQSAVAGDDVAQETIINAARDANGLPPVRIDAPTYATAGSTTFAPPVPTGPLDFGFAPIGGGQPEGFDGGIVSADDLFAPEPVPEPDSWSFTGETVPAL